MRAALKRRTHEMLKGRPGHRFQDRYRRTKESKTPAVTWVRIANLALALVAFAIGAVLTVIPGPAILFFFIGGGLLAAESLLVARAMDWLEVRLRKIVAWLRRHWRRLPTLGRAVVIGAGAFVSIATTYACWHLMRA
jgi:hypothetical protein